MFSATQASCTALPARVAPLASIVVMPFPATAAAGVTQLRVAWPSMGTVQALHRAAARHRGHQQAGAHGAAAPARARRHRQAQGLRQLAAARRVRAYRSRPQPEAGDELALRVGRGLPQAIDAAWKDGDEHRGERHQRGEHRVARGFLGAGGGALGRVDCLALQAVGLVQPLDAALLEPFVDPRRLAVEDAAIAHLAYLLEAQGFEAGEELLPGFGHYFLARLG